MFRYMVFTPQGYAVAGFSEYRDALEYVNNHPEYAARIDIQS